MAVPANLVYTAEFQDNRGFRAITRVVQFLPDISSASAFAVINLATLYGLTSQASVSVFATLAAMSNAKIIRESAAIEFNFAQEPTSETGTYQLVQDKAHLEFGDGNGGFTSIKVPAPKDGLFLTSGSENLTTVDPASTLLTNFQKAFTATNQIAQAASAATNANHTGLTARGGTYASQFFGGQYVGGKPRRRRVLPGG